MGPAARREYGDEGSRARGPTSACPTRSRTGRARWTSSRRRLGADAATLHRLLRALCERRRLRRGSARRLSYTDALDLVRRRQRLEETPPTPPRGPAPGARRPRRPGRADLSVDVVRGLPALGWPRTRTSGQRLTARWSRASAAAPGRSWPLELRGDDEGRRGRRRERHPARRPLQGAPGPARRCFRPPGDRPGRDRARRPDRVRRRRLLRAGTRGRRLRPLDDPPRLGRRAGDGDPAHDPRSGFRRLPALDPRRRRARGKRAGRRRSGSTC